ncbi:MAG TPA: M61 family peptidase [Bacteroidia bacterium]|nr:M61 family peptidase [Bacteroidia bacterium]HRG51227.1 M61 family peptidase [Bacteroidia bacterium]
MKYIISYQQPHQHYLDIEFIASNIQSEHTTIQLPAWRPGRYELGNFAKNIQKWEALDASGNPLTFEKTAKDTWKVFTKNVKQLHIRYNYFSNELNAGSTFLDATQLYVNPVNCCVFIPDRIHENCEVELLLPSSYKIACGLPSKIAGNKTLLVADDFHHLADSPFIASDSLQHYKFTCGTVEFNFWFQGECRINWEKLNNDFYKFCEFQLKMMKKAPFSTYHFIFQILPYRMYHGVEHVNSTVIALGPGYNLMKDKLYEDLLGVSCHELFHAWNIKTIRPLEMLPYDYTKENYSKLGYVCEGVTTYYGDQILSRAGVFSELQYLQSFNERIQKHLDNFGRFHLSVADSSFDTWLDGYVPGVPNRKTSIYDEGCLLAFATDLFIRKNSKNQFSLDDVMVYLYEEFALKQKGYSAADYKGVVEHFANTSLDRIVNFINKALDYTPLLEEAMDYIGCEFVKSASPHFHEHAIGIKVSEASGNCKVTAVYPSSVADVAGISVQDEIIAVNTIAVRSDHSASSFTEWCNYFSDQPLLLTIASNSRIRQVKIIPAPFQFYKMGKIQKLNTATVMQKANYKLWCGYEF